MIQAEQCFSNCINNPVRHVRARVDLYAGSTLLDTFRHNDRLKSLTIERVAEGGKFFGFGICQKLNVKLIDKARELKPTTENTLDVAFGTGCDFIYTSPYFRVTEVHRDETTNELSITAYDALYTATGLSVSQLELPETYTLADFTNACGALLGLPINIQDGAEAFATTYNGGANFEGSESVRAALDAIAEATQTIYYLDNQWRLTFKRLDRDGAAVAAINKNNYFDLDSSENRRLAAVCSATELGDNYIASLDVSGTTQYIRDNPFLEMREDIAELVDNALIAVGGLTINQFDCAWRGNYLIEIGDKISIETKDGATVYSYLLDDTITYDGVLSQKTRWQYDGSEGESIDNPTNLGEALRQTYAKVDKANKQIEIVVGDLEEKTESISALILETDSIVASVKSLETSTANALENIDNNIETLTKSVNAVMTEEDIKITIQEELSNGTNKVITATGYTFDEEGLRVSKTGSEMSSLLDEDGLSVFRDNTEVLTADNTGVNGINMTVRQYLIVGGSRFEEYGAGRTGCYWIGG